MTKPAEAPDPYGDLMADITRSIVVETGTREQIASAFASAVMTCLQRRKASNGLLYIAAPPKQHDVLQIAAALESGTSVRQVCRDHGVSRATLHRLFPGGLPVPRIDA